MADQDWEEALALLVVWNQQQSEDGNSRFWIAFCLERLGRLDEAREAALRAAGQDPTDHRVAKLLLQIEEHRRHQPSLGPPAPGRCCAAHRIGSREDPSRD